MLAADPLEIVRALDDAFSRGDVEGVLEHYQDEASVVVQPGVIVAGKPALRRAFEGILSSFKEPPTITQLKTHVMQVGDIALFTAKWSISGESIDGTTVQRVGDASSVFQKQSNGRWKLLIDNPWGPAVLG